MALDDDGSEQAVGAERSPRNVRRFVWALLLGVIVVLALVLLYLHFHAPVIQGQTAAKLISGWRQSRSGSRLPLFGFAAPHAESGSRRSQQFISGAMGFCAAVHENAPRLGW
jgi:hypothetical protein